MSVSDDTAVDSEALPGGGGKSGGGTLQVSAGGAYCRQLLLAHGLAQAGLTAKPTGSAAGWQLVALHIILARCEGRAYTCMCILAGDMGCGAQHLWDLSLPASAS